MEKSTTRITKGVKKSITKKKHSAKTKIKSISRAHPVPRVDNSTTNKQINLRSLSMPNIDPEVAKDFWDDWDFEHLGAVFDDLRTDNQGKDFFVVVGPAYATLLAERVVHIPSIVILIAPSGQQPPTYVLRKNPADNQDDEVIDFQRIGLGWKPFGNRKLGKGVFALKNVNNENTDDIATAILWTMSQESTKRKKNGDLEIEIANFRYAGENERGEVVEIDEAYSKGFSEYSSILDMHDMDYTAHVEPLKAAVKRGFNASRDKLENRLTMLQNEFPNHLDYKMVKIFPQNAFEAVPTENSLSYFNEFYGKSDKTYLKIDSDGQLIKLGGN
jgi:hypothetical protein